MWESGFAYGRSEASPDSEQIEHVIAEQFMRNSVSVEQIQDRGVRRTGEGIGTCHCEAEAERKTKGRNGIPPRLILFPRKVPAVRKGHQSAMHIA